MQDTPTLTDAVVQNLFQTLGLWVAIIIIALGICLYLIIKFYLIPNEVNKIWLQVETENEEAMKLYTNLGLKKAYSYYYLQKSL